jgi:Protein of unknown function (DUF3225)
MPPTGIATDRRTRAPQALTHVVDTSVGTRDGHEAATANLECTRAGRKGRQRQTWIRLPEGWRRVAAPVSVLHESGETPGFNVTSSALLA